MTALHLAGSVRGMTGLPGLAGLAELEPIGLEELVERAALLTRVDRKYVVPVGDLRALVAAVPARTRVLEIAGRRSFGYRSAYLDTPDLDSFLGAGRSHRLRWKVRTRSYLDAVRVDAVPGDGATWLEVKTRGARGQTLKQRIAHPDAESVSRPGGQSGGQSGSQSGGLTDDGRAFVAAIVGSGPADVVRPVLATAYQRSTLFLPASSSRVTIDVGLGWSSLETVRDLDRPGVAIVETKTGSTPSAVDRLLWTRGHRPVRISKYGVGMAALSPSLPRLKWHHVLDRHLGLPRAA